jgi:hypothetical protein
LCIHDAPFSEQGLIVRGGAQRWHSRAGKVRGAPPALAALTRTAVPRRRNVVKAFVDKGTRDKIHVLGSGKAMQVCSGQAGCWR